MRFYVTEQISPRIAETPEGFLLCSDVPITRTGTLLYGKDEVPVDPDASGMVQIDRVAEDVFSEATIASFEGKPITINHPEEMVTPETWKDLAHGHLQNVRRGQGDQSDLLLADFLVTDSKAIAYVRAGLREVSCGYDADYEQVIPGRGYQRNIIGNHVALVSRGRAGARCSIQDSHPCTGCGQCKCKTKDSKETKAMTIKDRLKKAFPFLDAKVIDAVKDEDLEEKKETTDAEEISSLKSEVEGLKKTIDELVESDKKVHEAMDAMKKTRDSEEEAEAKKKAEAEEKEKKESAGDKKTKDAAFFKDAVCRAEIIKPGHQMPTFDAATCDTEIQKLQREVLAHAYQTDDGKRAIEPFTRGPVKDFASLDRATLDAAFIGASAILSEKNNAKFGMLGGKTNDWGKPVTVSDINKRNADFWGGRK